MLRLVLFDFDGVIADSERTHFDAIRTVCKEEDIDLQWDIYCDRYLGYTDLDCFNHIMEDHGKAVSGPKIAEMMAKKGDIFTASLANSNIILPGVVEFITKLTEAGIYCSICSGASRHEIDVILEPAKIIQYFKVIVSSDDVKKGKPDPQGYLLALKKTNQILKINEPVTAEQCLVVEDSTWGIQAGIAAKMKTLAVTNSYPAEQLTQADKVVHSLADINIGEIKTLLGN